MLTQHHLKTLVSYDPETGVFVRKSNGKVAGGKDNGYLRIFLEGKRYRAHQLAWLYIHGVWPRKDIDHIDLNRSNNRISNLREATRSENLRNTKPQRRNKTGLKGVRPDRNRKGYIAQISFGGRTTYLGRFDTPAEASATYMAAATKSFVQFARAK